MGLLQIIGLIISILTSLPKIIGLVKDIIKSIRGIKEPALRRAAIKELKMAIAKVKKTGDTSYIEKLYTKHVSNGGV